MNHPWMCILSYTHITSLLVWCWRWTDDLMTLICELEVGILKTHPHAKCEISRSRFSEVKAQTGWVWMHYQLHSSVVVILAFCSEMPNNLPKNITGHVTHLESEHRSIYSIAECSTGQPGNSRRFAIVVQWCLLLLFVILHCELKKHNKMFLSYLSQNHVDSDKIWYTVLNKFAIQKFKCFPDHLNSE